MNNFFLKMSIDFSAINRCYLFGIKRDGTAIVISEFEISRENPNNCTICGTQMDSALTLISFFEVAENMRTVNNDSVSSYFVSVSVVRVGERIYENMFPIKTDEKSAEYLRRFTTLAVLNYLKKIN